MELEGQEAKESALEGDGLVVVRADISGRGEEREEGQEMRAKGHGGSMTFTITDYHDPVFCARLK
jgi:hypothetical protein